VAGVSPIARLLVGTAGRVAAAVLALAVVPGVVLVGRGGPVVAGLAVVAGAVLGWAARRLADATATDVPARARRIRPAIAWFRASPAVASLALAVLAGRALFEEVWWRGPVLVARHLGLAPLALAGVVLGTSAGFALVHRVGARASAVYFALSTGCAALCLATGGLLAATAAHTTYNALWHAGAQRREPDPQLAT
jgi:hypothetical protein